MVSPPTGQKTFEGFAHRMLTAINHKWSTLCHNSYASIFIGSVLALGLVVGWEWSFIHAGLFDWTFFDPVPGCGLYGYKTLCRTDIYHLQMLLYPTVAVAIP